MRAFKKLVSGTPFEQVWTTPEQRTHYQFSIDRMIEGIEKGKALEPPTIVFLIIPQDISPGASLSGLRQNPTQPEGLENKCLSQVLPNSKILSRWPLDHTCSGFTFFIPPIEALEFPPELIRILNDVLEKYPDDLMTLRTCLIACYIFKQVIEHSDMLMERFMQMRRAEGGSYHTFPEICLAAALIYIPHWLRCHEYMGLTEYLHPFRFTYRTLDTD